ncbi:MAG: 50S ribosomal protein L18, partial [Hyphomicrobiaceae bacterium]
MLRKLNQFDKRKMRVRRSLERSADRPRLSVFRSSKHIYAQVIDDA